MDELDIATITQRSIKGILALVSRSFVIQLISQLVGFLLTYYLFPAQYGVYFIVSSVILFLGYFSDIGLAAALIQKKEAISEKDLQTTFTIQQVLVISGVAVALYFSAFVGKFYHLDTEGVFLYQALVVAFFLSSLKTIPSIILERNLQFQKLIIPEIIETLFFNITVLILAMKGFGITSFAYAVLLRGISGLIAMYIIAPWKVRIGFSKNIAKKLLSFGIPFQTNSLLALIKDNLLILYLGKVLLPAELGFVGYAQKMAYIPLRLVMDNLIRITFPSFSRLSHDAEYLGKAIEKTLFAISLLIFPSLAGLVILLPYLMHLLPKYEKWQPALISLSFFAINAALSSLSTPLVNALNAIGKIKISLYLMVFWTVVTWVLTPFTISVYGFNGVAVASAIISLSIFGVVIIAKRFINFSVVRVILMPVIATLVMSAGLFLISPYMVKNIFLLFITVVIGAMLYTGVIMLLARKQILADIQFIRTNLKQ